MKYHGTDIEVYAGDVVGHASSAGEFSVARIDEYDKTIRLDNDKRSTWCRIDCCRFIRRDLPPKAEEPERAETRTHDTGAVRSTDADDVAYWCMPLLGLRRVAKTAKEGAVNYSPNNWKKGFKASVLYDHAMEHLVKWGAGDRGEDHIAHAAWNLLALADFQEQGRTDLMDCEPKS